MTRHILLGISFCAALGVSLNACAADAPPPQLPGDCHKDPRRVCPYLQSPTDPPAKGHLSL